MTNDLTWPHLCTLSTYDGKHRVGHDLKCDLKSEHISTYGKRFCDLRSDTPTRRQFHLSHLAFRQMCDKCDRWKIICKCNCLFSFHLAFERGWKWEEMQICISSFSRWVQYVGKIIKSLLSIILVCDTMFIKIYFQDKISECLRQKVH